MIPVIKPFWEIPLFLTGQLLVDIKLQNTAVSSSNATISQLSKTTLTRFPKVASVSVRRAHGIFGK